MKRKWILIVAMVLAVGMLFSFPLIGCKTTTTAAVTTAATAAAIEIPSPWSNADYFGSTTTPSYRGIPEKLVETSQYKKAPPWRIGISNISVVNTWRVELMKEFNEEAAKWPNLISELLITDAGGDVSKQIADMEDLITKNVDAIIVTPISPTALNPVIEKAYDKGIVVIVFSTNASTEKVNARVLSDYYLMAKQGVDWLAEKLNGKGKVIAFRGIAGNTAEDDEWLAVEDMMKANPDIELLASPFCDWAYDKAKTAADSMFAAYPVIDGVMGMGNAAAAVATLEELKKPLIPMCDASAFNGMLRIMKEKNMDSVVVSDPTWVSQVALITAMKALNGEKIPSYQTMPLVSITQENIDKFFKPDLPDTYFADCHLSDKTLNEIFKVAQ